MHIIKLQIQDSIYDHIMFLLKNLNTKELRIIEDSREYEKKSQNPDNEILAFSNHSANIVEEWLDESEDDIWK